MAATGGQIRRRAQEMLKKYNDLDKALEKIDFSHLINQVYKIRKNSNNKYVFPKQNHLRKNIAALIELRNSVMHNRFLLLYRGFEECYVGDNSLKSASLKDNIINLINFLPANITEKCRNEINHCLEERNNQDKTAWLVPDFIKFCI